MSIDEDQYRRLFGDDALDAYYEEQEEREGKERKGRVQNVSECCEEWNRKRQEVEEVKRVHFKGRGKTIRPTCPHCQRDLRRSYEYIKNEKTGKRNYIGYGWHCEVCPYDIRDNKD